MRYWLDLSEIQGGDLWENAIEDALRRADVLVVYVTKNIVGSYVEREIALAIGANKSILPVVMDDTIASEAPIAETLRKFQYIEGRGRPPELVWAETIERIKKLALARVVAVYNVKGGVGKTTLALQLAAAFYGWRGKRVLLIDLDPQTNLSSSLIKATIEKAKSAGGIWGKRQAKPVRVDVYAALIQANRTLLTVLRALDKADADVGATFDVSPYIHHLAGEEPGAVLRILPSQHDVRNIAAGAPRAQIERIAKGFRRVIEKLRREYDLIILDMNPSFSELTRIGLQCATCILSPMRPDAYSIQGIDLLDDIVGDMRAEIGSLDHHILLNNGKPGDNTVVRQAFQKTRYNDRLLAAEVPESRYFYANPKEQAGDGVSSLVGLRLNPNQPHARALEAVVSELEARLELKT